MKFYKILIAVFLLVPGLATPVLAQSFEIDQRNSSLKVDGTSNIHDWSLNAENFHANLEIEMRGSILKDISKLEFTLEPNSLKSGKAGMDKNTYRALKTSKNEKISFNIKEVKNINQLSETKFKVSTTGILEIAGVKKQIPLFFYISPDQDKISLEGEYNLAMTDYGVEPPTAMFGTIKTGDRVRVTFQIQFKKQLQP